MVARPSTTSCRGQRSTLEPALPRSLIGAALAVLLGSCGVDGTSEAPIGELAASGNAVDVVRVLDGDTFEVVSERGHERVRLREVGAPETHECGGEAATELLRRLGGEGVELDRRGSDRSGRTLAHVHTPSGVHVQRELVAAGLAHVATYGQPDEHLDSLLAAEAEARREQRGLYGGGLGCGEGVLNSDLPPVRVLELDANPEGDDLVEGAGESVLLEGPPGLALAGWSLKDTSASHRFAFAEGTRLGTDGRLRVYTSCGTPGPGVLHWCRRGSAVWNNTGDTAYLLDPNGRVVSWLDYVSGP